jgi:hypothetical protein
MLNFEELSADGQDLELLVRELLFIAGLRCYWSGKGPDGGRDLLAIEEVPSAIATTSRTWLVQCKHNAKSGNSVGIGDLDGIVDSCHQHGADGYLLVCSTQPSSGVVNRLEAITKNPTQRITATYWDAVRIEQILSSPRQWRLAQRFFPVSSQAADLKVYATENPNHWIAILRGNYMHLTNRIGSRDGHYFPSINERLNDIQKLNLPEGHFVRIRSVYYDDKNGGFTWYLDYMHPHDQPSVVSTAQMKRHLGDGYALEDGQLHSFDVLSRSYLPFSDHYDPDHYKYYEPYVRQFLYGQDRDLSFEQQEERYAAQAALEEEVKKTRSSDYDALVESIGRLRCVSVVRSSNAQIEYLDRFDLVRDWSSLFEDLKIDSDRFFSVWLLLRVADEAAFKKMMTYLPQGFSHTFRLTRVHVYLPTDDDKSEPSDDNDLFELTISVDTDIVETKAIGRAQINGYLQRITTAIRQFASET